MQLIVHVGRCVSVYLCVVDTFERQSDRQTARQIRRHQTKHHSTRVFASVWCGRRQAHLLYPYTCESRTKCGRGRGGPPRNNDGHNTTTTTHTHDAMGTKTRNGSSRVQQSERERGAFTARTSFPDNLTLTERSSSVHGRAERQEFPRARANTHTHTHETRRCRRR